MIGWMIRRPDGALCGPFDRAAAEHYANPLDEVFAVNEHGNVIDYGPQFDEGEGGDDALRAECEQLKAAMLYTRATIARRGLHDLHTYYDDNEQYVDPLDDPRTRSLVRTTLAELARTGRLT
jgi:hypothetical protein